VASVFQSHAHGLIEISGEHDCNHLAIDPFPIGIASGITNDTSRRFSGEIDQEE